MSPEGFGIGSRAAWTRRLTEEEFDLLVIGGGAVGASVFRDAALRGLRVALLEGRDFASGASSRSSKLIHGCLRHLRQGQLGLVWEACHERDLLARLNPHLVRPEPFLIPLYEGRGPSHLALRLAMILYDVLSGFRNHRWHRVLSPAATQRLAPALPRVGLRGGLVYWDAVVNDARWTVETVKDGVRAGGVALNYTPVRQLLHQDGRVVGAVAEDGVAAGGQSFVVRAHAVVNAAGGSADVVRRMDRPDARPLVRLSKGTHLVFGRLEVPFHASVVLFSPRDGRPLVLSRRQGCFLYGTTDAWEDDGDPASPRPGETDCDDLLKPLQELLPGSGLSAARVRSVYSGYRALPAFDGPANAPAWVRRDDLIELSPSGLISVVGGKLTTARRVALRVLDKVIARLGRSAWRRPSVTHLRPLGDGSAGGVELLCRNEMVCTLEDLVERRLDSLSWTSQRRLRFLSRNAAVIRAELGLSEDAFKSQFLAYRTRLRQLHALPRVQQPPRLVCSPLHQT